MGQSSIIAVFAALFLGGILMHNVQRTTMDTEEKLYEHQYHVIARDASTTGMNTTIRKLATGLSSTSWRNNDILGTYDVIDEPYNGGFYTISHTIGDCSILSVTKLDDLNADLRAYDPLYDSDDHLIEIRSTGHYEVELEDDDEQSHQVVACYVQTDYDTGKPPAFMYAFISEQNFTFNGGPDILSYVDGEGNVHSNEDIDLGPNVTIDGHVTMVDIDESTFKEDKTEFSSFTEGQAQPLELFDPTPYYEENYAANEINVSHRIEGDYTVSGQETFGSAALNGPGNPYIWVIEGDLIVSKNSHLILPGYTIVIVYGMIELGGNAHITVTNELPPQDGTIEELKAWINLQLDGGKSKTAFYSAAGYPGPEYNPDNPPLGVKIHGTSTVVGNFYTNGDFEMDGGGQGDNMVGNVTSLGTITANGGGNGSNFWYADINDEVIIPGIKIPARQIIRVALAEWTDPVYDHPPVP